MRTEKSCSVFCYQSTFQENRFFKNLLQIYYFIFKLLFKKMETINVVAEIPAQQLKTQNPLSHPGYLIWCFFFRPLPLHE